MISPRRDGSERTVTPKREWYATRDGTSFCVDPIPWAMRCMIPVVPGGDSADTASLSQRTARCNHPTFTLVGSGPTCGHHLVTVFRIAGVKSRVPIPACPPMTSEG